MKVLLINSPLFRDYNPLYDEDSLPPIGLGYIGTQLRLNGIETYLINEISDVPLDRSFFGNEPVNHPLGFVEANIVASRGCVYNCTFCAAARSLNKDYPVRERSDASIIEEVRQIKRDFPQVSSI